MRRITCPYPSACAATVESLAARRGNSHWDDCRREGCSIPGTWSPFGGIERRLTQGQQAVTLRWHKILTIRSPKTCFGRRKQFRRPATRLPPDPRPEQKIALPFGVDRKRVR